MTVMVDEGLGELLDRCSEEVSVEVTQDVVESVGENGVVDWLHTEVGHDALVGGVGFQRVRRVLPLQ